MEYISTKEASKKWGISPIRITVLANEGRIPGAYRLGKSWLIPSTATKPENRKTSRSKQTKKEANSFSLPIYHLRPDWNNTKESDLSAQQKNLLLAENAVFECQFSYAYPLLNSIMQSPDDINNEIGSLWNAGICCVALNKPKDFSRIFLRLQMLLSEDFPHQKDLLIVLDALKTYTETINSAASKSVFNTDIHDQCIPLACMNIGYANLTKEAMKLDSADTNLLEINLRFLETTSSITAVAFMHLYLLGIYLLRNDMVLADKHAKNIVQITFENKLYFPLVTYYRYFAPIISPILAQYPEEFQEHCNELIAEYEKNFKAFLSSFNDSTIVPKLNDEDYPLIYAILSGLPNPLIAEKLGIHPQTVKRKIAKICKLVGVASKKELKEFLQNNI